MFKRLKDKIEENRNSTNLFWRISVRTKDFIWNLFQIVIKGKENPEKIFGKIYKDEVWGKKGDFFSGAGSLPENTLEYRKFIEKFIKEKKIKNVVDLGCGDFRIGKGINWNKTTYIGIDVVPSLIERNSKLYSSRKTKFIKKDIIKDKLPNAELCIIKEVFQHLPNEAILKILKKTKKYKYILIIDTIREKNNKNSNKQIKMGEFRMGGLCLEYPPFNQKIKKTIEYKRKDAPRLFKIVLIEN